MKKRTIADIISNSTEIAGSPNRDGASVQPRCELCGQLLPAMHIVSPKQVLASVVCGLALAAVLGPAAYFGIQWMADHFHGLVMDPPWHEPLEYWELN